MEPSDWELIQQFRSGDETAFDTLISRHKEPLVRALERLVQSHEVARDLAHHAFVAVYMSPPHRGEVENFARYLVRIATNEAMDEKRSGMRWQGLLSQFRATTPESPRTPEDLAIAKEGAVLLRKAVNELPLTMRCALMLREVEGLSVEEIADQTGSNAIAVRTNISRARGRLRHTLSSWWSGGSNDRRREGRSDRGSAEETAGSPQPSADEFQRGGVAEDRD
jgi:RNA polymerase sigma-70 factor (ECF subfamily)